MRSHSARASASSQSGASGATRSKLGFGLTSRPPESRPDSVEQFQLSRGAVSEQPCTESPTAEGTLAGAACAKVATKRGWPLGRDIFLPLRLFAADAPGNGTQPRSVGFQRITRSQQRDGETRSEAGICPRVKRSAALMPHNLSRERNLPAPLKIRTDWFNPSIAHHRLRSSESCI